MAMIAALLAGCSSSGGEVASSPASSSTTTSSRAAPAEGAEATELQDSGPVVAVADWDSEPLPMPFDGAVIEIPYAIESRVDDVDTTELSRVVETTLSDPRGWNRAGVRFREDATAGLEVVLAEPGEVDALCAPLQTGGRWSCQNGPVVALNAERWRSGVDHWPHDVDSYRQYLVNHEVGHLFGQRHPQPLCRAAGQPAPVMGQQSKSLDGCLANTWPLAWEIERAGQRPLHIAPPPSWPGTPEPSNPGAVPGEEARP